MWTMVKLGLVLLISIVVVMLILLVLGVKLGGPGTDSNNSKVHSNTSQDLLSHAPGGP